MTATGTSLTPPSGSSEATGEEAWKRVLQAASQLRGLHIEGQEVLHSDSQGLSDELVCLDKWLCWRDGAIRMQLRVLARDSAEASWDCLSEGGFSEPLSETQAMALIEHWDRVEQSSIDRRRESRSDQWERVRAFGPAR